MLTALMKQKGAYWAVFFLVFAFTIVVAQGKASSGESLILNETEMASIEGGACENCVVTAWGGCDYPRCPSVGCANNGWDDCVAAGAEFRLGGCNFTVSKCKPTNNQQAPRCYQSTGPAWADIWCDCNAHSRCALQYNYGGSRSYCYTDSTLTC